ncbi:MAG: winged helix-turn-helix domain-containing protein [Acidimicrobiales bacterium]
MTVSGAGAAETLPASVADAAEVLGYAEVDDSDDPREMRQLTSAQEMRALTHPIRLALLEVLSLEGAMTATEAGERIGESATTCSFHLRQLAKYGFVEEAGGGAGRRRPWKVVQRGLRLSGVADVEQSIAANELRRLVMSRWLQRDEQWSAVQHLDPVWAEIPDAMQIVAYLTADEAATVQAEITALLERFRDRLTDASLRPAAARPIESVLMMHPLLSPHPLPTES